jgi:hypothetical protein
VRDRFRGASMRGTPHWLWPDLSVDEWQSAVEQIAAVSRRVIGQGEAGCTLAGDPVSLGVAGYTSGMGPLLGYWTSTGQVACSPALAAILDLHLRHNTLRMGAVLQRALKISGALESAGIEHALLKGMHTAYAYFPIPGTRPLADIDLLIDATRRVDASLVLRQLGLRLESERTLPDEQTWRWADSPAPPRSLSLVHFDDPVTLDLHFSLDRRYGAGSPIIRFGALLDGSPFGSSGATPWAGVLPQPLLLLYLSAHASCGLTNMTLIRLVELKLVIRQDIAAGRLAWDELLDAGERAGLLGACYAAFKFCEALFPDTFPEQVVSRARKAAPDKARRLLDKLEPANAHRMLRCSLAERFMWAPTPWAIVRQALSEVIPQGSTSWRTLAAIYRTRLFRIARRTVTL